MKYLIDFDHTLMDTEALKVVVAKEGRLSMVGTPELWNYHSITTTEHGDRSPLSAKKRRNYLY